MMVRGFPKVSSRRVRGLSNKRQWQRENGVVPGGGAEWDIHIVGDIQGGVAMKIVKEGK